MYGNHGKKDGLLDTSVYKLSMHVSYICVCIHAYSKILGMVKKDWFTLFKCVCCVCMCVCMHVLHVYVCVYVYMYMVREWYVKKQKVYMILAYAK